MILKSFYDETVDGILPTAYPFILVYCGTQAELMDITIHCRLYCKTRFRSGSLVLVGNRVWQQDFFFLSKSDAMFCKLSHNV